MRHNLPRDAQKAHHLALQIFVPLRVVNIGELDRRHTAGIIDQNMNRAESLQRVTDQPPDIVEPAHIALHGQHLGTGIVDDSIPCLQKFCFTAGANHNPRAFGR